MCVMGDILYHYCSVENFFNIIQNCSLRLSDVSKSDAYPEYDLCRDKVRKSIEDLLSEKEEDLKLWKKGLAYGARQQGEMYTYCACFSESCDRSSQWKEYADKGRGVAIGFDKESLLELERTNKHSVAFGPVIYERRKQEAYIEKIAKDNMKKMKKKGIAHVALELNANYRLKFPFIKDQGSWEENEWRIAVSSRLGARGTRMSRNYEFSEVKYRVENRKLISYIEMDFSKNRKELIKEIWLGPKSAVSVDDTIGFLDSCGYYDVLTFDANGPILIKESRVVYR